MIRSENKVKTCEKTQLPGLQLCAFAYNSHRTVNFILSREVLLPEVNVQTVKKVWLLPAANIHSFRAHRHSFLGLILDSSRCCACQDLARCHHCTYYDDTAVRFKNVHPEGK
jgi:hypothetical protein